MTADLSRCDLHVHSRYSTDSGNYALRRARLGESYTEPERVHRVCKSRGMRFVTISDHNTLEGALRIAHLPDTFLSVEVTTRFPEDGVPLHVLVWNLTEEDHLDLQELRPSVYALTAFLRGRGLAHALAHPLYRMGAPLTPSHVERLMLLFPVWEGATAPGRRPRTSSRAGSRRLRPRRTCASWPSATGSSRPTTARSGSRAAPTTTARSTSRPRGPRRPVRTSRRSSAR